MKDRNTALFAEGGNGSAGGQWKPGLGFCFHLRRASVWGEARTHALPPCPPYSIVAVGKKTKTDAKLSYWSCTNVDRQTIGRTDSGKQEQRGWPRSWLMPHCSYSAHEFWKVTNYRKPFLHMSWGYLSVYTYDLNSIRVSIDLHLSVIRNFYSVIESVNRWQFSWRHCHFLSKLEWSEYLLKT